MSSPAVTPLGPVLEMTRSAWPTTVVFTVWLLGVAGSLMAFDAVAVFCTGPAVVGAVMAIVSVESEPPLGIEVELVQVMTPPLGAPHDQPVPEALAPVTPAGRVLVT